jgi:hypothetical protein
MERASLIHALDAFLGRNVTASVMRELRQTIARLRVAHPQPEKTVGFRYELDALVRQLSRTPRRRG